MIEGPSLACVITRQNQGMRIKSRDLSNRVLRTQKSRCRTASQDGQPIPSTYTAISVDVHAKSQIQHLIG